MDEQWQLLLVDDEPDIVEELAECLETEGFICHTATSAAQARAVFAAEPDISILITDLAMPGESGLDLLQSLRGETRPFAAIVLTGQSGEREVIESLRLGVSDYQKKPIDIAALCEAITRAHEDLAAQLQARSLERAVHTLQEQVVRDPLTGLFNRRYMEDTLEREFARAEREASPLALVLLDVDEFKNLNDAYGHIAGDAVLVALADTLRRYSRRADVVCRYGGEEFVIVMPGADAADALPRVEQWRHAFAAARVPFEGRMLRARFSAGIASYPRNGATAAAVLQAADEALYAAKGAGRNCSRMASAVGEPVWMAELGG